MRAAALLLLLPALALAQPAPSGGACSLSATCAAKKFSLKAGNQLCLNSTTCTTWIQASTSTGGMRLNSGLTNAGSNAAYSFDTTNALSGNTLILNVGQGGVQKLTVGNDGTITTLGNFTLSTGALLGGWGTPQKIDMNSGSNGIRLASGTVGGGDITFGDLGGTNWAHVSASGLFVYSSESPVVITHAAQSGIGGATNGVAMEFGHTAASAGGVLAVSFATAFGVAPACTCADNNATPVPCGVTTTASTTAVTFSITSARADSLDWQCIGVK